MAKTQGRQARSLRSTSARLVEVDGEFCVPQEAGQARHYIDLGPIFGEVERSGVVPRSGSSSCSSPRSSCSSSPIQLMKDGRGRRSVPRSKGSSRSRTRPLDARDRAGSARTSCSRDRRSPRRRSASSAPRTITKLETLTMLSGIADGRIVHRARHRVPLRDAAQAAIAREGLGIGIQAMTMTAIQYLPGMLIAFTAHAARARSTGWTGTLRRSSTPFFGAALGADRGPRAEANLPGWGLFLVGLVHDPAVVQPARPRPAARGLRLHRVETDVWLKHPWTMFLLGCLVATLTLSVSVALTVLVPLAVKGYVKRDEALPYIMGANITTLADTLVVAMLQPDARRRADRAGRGDRRHDRLASSSSRSSTAR